MFICIFFLKSAQLFYTKAYDSSDVVQKQLHLITTLCVKKNIMLLIMYWLCTDLIMYFVIMIR